MLRPQPHAQSCHPVHWRRGANRLPADRHRPGARGDPGLGQPPRPRRRHPGNPRLYERLAQGRPLARYDKRGAGHSDPVAGAEGFTLDCQVRDLERVLAAAGVRRTALLGWSRSGPIAIEFAARHPDRVTALVLYGTYARSLVAADHPEGRPPGRLKALIDLLG